MFQTKYQFHNFMAYDYAVVEEYLEKMEADGWRFERVINKRLWKFRKTEPVTVKYSITYIPGVSEYSPWPKTEQIQLQDYCREAGWWKVANWRKMQIFRTDDAENVPIETDETQRLSMIKKNMWKSYLPGIIVLLFLFLYDLYAHYYTAKWNAVSYFATNTMFWLLPFTVIGTVYLISTLLHYSAWLREAKKAVISGLEIQKPGKRPWINRWGGYLLMVLFLGYLVSTSIQTALAYVLIIPLFFWIGAVLQKLRERLREERVAYILNRLLTFVAGVALVWAALTVTGILLTLVGTGLEGSEPVAELQDPENERHYYNIYRDALPLTTGDWYTAEDAEYPPEANTSYRIMVESSSMVLNYGEYKQCSYFTREEVPGVYYRTIEVKAEFLLDFLRKNFMENREQNYLEEKTKDNSIKVENVEYQLQDISVGEGILLYRLSVDGTLENDWVISKDNRIAQLESDVELTVEQLRIAAEKLVQ